MLPAQMCMFLRQVVTYFLLSFPLSSEREGLLNLFSISLLFLFNISHCDSWEENIKCVSKQQWHTKLSAFNMIFAPSTHEQLKDTATIGKHVLGNSYLLFLTKIYRLWRAKATSAICTSSNSKMLNITGQSILLGYIANEFRRSKSLMQRRRCLHIQILYMHIDGSQQTNPHCNKVNIQRAYQKKISRGKLERNPCYLVKY